MLTTYAKRQNFQNPLCLLTIQTYLSTVKIVKSKYRAQKKSEWFPANKLSLNEDKTRLTLFDKL